MDEELPLTPTSPPGTQLSDVELEPSAPVDNDEANVDVEEIQVPMDVASLSLEDEGAVGGRDENQPPPEERVVMRVEHDTRPTHSKQSSEYT